MFSCAAPDAQHQTAAEPIAMCLQVQEHQAVVTELRQQLLTSDQALAAAQQAAQRQHEEHERAMARLSALQADCGRLQGQLEGQTAARRAAEDQVGLLLLHLMYT
jgi:hypothetical protein